MGSDNRGDRRWTNEQLGDPERIAELIGYLGTEEEGKALWWLSQAGEQAVPQLLHAYLSAMGSQKIGIGFALALQNRKELIDEMHEVIRRRCEYSLLGESNRVEERWVAAFVVLKRIRAKTGFVETISLLRTEPNSQLCFIYCNI